MIKKKKDGKVHIWVLATAILVAVATLFVYFLRYGSSVRKIEEIKEYSNYYAMIVPDRKSAFWQAVYEGAVEAGAESGAFVELLGENLARDYDRNELLEIAISADVDGIVLVADGSKEVEDLIEKAQSEGIPVVTLYSDSPDSVRCSFVGISNYNLGKEYGAQLRRLLGDQKYINKDVEIALFVNSMVQDPGQNILASGIQDSIERLYMNGSVIQANSVDLRLVAVDETNDLAVEEAVRKLLIDDEDPIDIFICLNEMETTTVYQTVVDYNRVGDVQILGYYDSNSILQAVKRGVIYSTVALDTGKMGEACIAALNEYKEMGYTSQYFTADVTLIDKSNVAQYLEEVAK